ncbi:MAG: type II toxin-antitoxin system VapC family toxin [Chitinispirillia bacterium]|nr:type II toxin-antitoxin system VapC family toxin [Chitinispirillia bacterium]
MRKPKIYLETTIFNHFFDTERDAHADTVELFREIQAGKYDAYTSSYVIDELSQADEPKRSNMLALIAEYNITVLDAADEARDLADIYVSEGIIPVKYRYDGLHIAIATINDLEYIVSLNFKHINKVKTKTMTGLINVRNGYKQILITTPMEVTENDEN